MNILKNLDLIYFYESKLNTTIKPKKSHDKLKRKDMMLKI